MVINHLLTGMILQVTISWTIFKQTAAGKGLIQGPENLLQSPDVLLIDIGPTKQKVCLGFWSYNPCFFPVNNL